jgi:hypothetical protein
MKASELTRYALCLRVAAAMLAGCSGSQPPIGALNAMPQTSAGAVHVERDNSWMASSIHGRPRMCKTGNARIRKALYMPAMVALRFNPTLRLFEVLIR